MDKATFIALIRKAGLSKIHAGAAEVDGGYAYEEWDEQIEKFAELVIAAERARAATILDGIDKCESESENGWWETSTRAEFGASILKKIRGEA